MFVVVCGSVLLVTRSFYVIQGDSGGFVTGRELVGGGGLSEDDASVKPQLARKNLQLSCADIGE